MLGDSKNIIVTVACLLNVGMVTEVILVSYYVPQLFYVLSDFLFLTKL